MDKEYIDIINSILNSKSIEGIKLQKTDLLKRILLDGKSSEKIYKDFLFNFSLIGDHSMLYTKIQDLVYTLNFAINEWLVPLHHIKDSSQIEKTIDELVEKDIDLYSSVSYNDFDKELLEEFENVLNESDIKI